MPKINVKMLETQKGSEDGCTVSVYEKGEEYLIERDLANVFIENKWAQRRVKKIADDGPPPEMHPPVEDQAEDNESEVPLSIQDTKPKTWVGRTLRNIEDGSLHTVASVSGNQVFFEDNPEGVDYRAVRKTMEVI